MADIEVKVHEVRYDLTISEREREILAEALEDFEDRTTADLRPIYDALIRYENGVER